MSDKKQIDLDFPPYQKHSRTSLAAAAEVKSRTPTLRMKVLAYIRETGGATDNEIQEALSMNGSTQRPRRVELLDKRLIRDSGATRLTKSKRQAVVWEPVDAD